MFVLKLHLSVLFQIVTLVRGGKNPVFVPNTPLPLLPLPLGPVNDKCYLQILNATLTCESNMV